MNTKKSSKKRITQPISITLTPLQRAWVDSMILPGGTRTEVIRFLVDCAMKSDLALKLKRLKEAV